VVPYNYWLRLLTTAAAAAFCTTSALTEYVYASSVASPFYHLYLTLFHSHLKTYLFHKSFQPWTFFFFLITDSMVFRLLLVLLSFCCFVFSTRCNIYISCLSYDASVRLSVTFVHCGHRVRWIPDTFACLDRWMSLLLTDNAWPRSSDGIWCRDFCWKREYGKSGTVWLDWAIGPTSYLNAGRLPGQLLCWYSIYYWLLVTQLYRHFKNAQLTINRHEGARGDTVTKPNTYRPTSTFQ